MIFSTDKLPIVIIALPRSGSTALGENFRIYAGPNTPYFNDPGYFPEKLSELLEYHTLSSRYILKCSFGGMQSYPDQYKQHILYDPNVYRLRLRRHNMFYQNLSSYIARCSNRWRYLIGSDLEPKEVVIDQALIEETIVWNYKENESLSNLDVNFDQDLWYEELSLNHGPDVPTPRPLNYDQIFEEFVKTYDRMGLPKQYLD